LGVPEINPAAGVDHPTCSPSPWSYGVRKSCRLVFWRQYTLVQDLACRARYALCDPNTPSVEQKGIFLTGVLMLGLAWPQIDLFRGGD